MQALAANQAVAVRATGKVARSSRCAAVVRRPVLSELAYIGGRRALRAPASARRGPPAPRLPPAPRRGVHGRRIFAPRRPLPTG
jgi:hypothetical protein